MLYLVLSIVFNLSSVHLLHINNGNGNILTVERSSPCPDVFQVAFETDIADSPIIIEVTKSLAPIGAQRFYDLIMDGFYDTAALFRVVPGFVLQFGISGNSDQNDKWLHEQIDDDPVIGSNTIGTLSFAATSRPNSRTTQVFINYGDNSRLDAMGFAPFGVVVSGLDVAVNVHNPTPGDSNGVDQGDYEKKGNSWIEEKYPGINFINRAVIHDNQV